MSHSMGLGKLAKPEIVFVRKFRFILGSVNFDPHCIYSLEIDWTAKSILISAYEYILDGLIPIHEWADAMEAGNYPEETLTLITVDGCGLELYRRVFKGLKIQRRKNTFNYNTSDVSTHDIILTYDEMEKQAVQEEKHETSEPKEVEINHLNAKTFLPL